MALGDIEEKWGREASIGDGGELPASRLPHFRSRVSQGAGQPRQFPRRPTTARGRHSEAVPPGALPADYLVGPAS